MGRLPVLRIDPTMTAAGYHSPKSSVGSQSWSRDTSHGETPLQVGSVAIVCEEQGKVKGVGLTYPLVKIRSSEQVFHKNNVRFGRCCILSFFRVIVCLFLMFCDELLHLRYFRIAETLVPQCLSRSVAPWLRTRRPGVRIPHGVPKTP